MPTKYPSVVVDNDAPEPEKKEAPAFEIPPYPAHFADLPVAIETWNFLCEHLARLKLFDAVDRVKLEFLCMAMSEYRRLWHWMMTPVPQGFGRDGQMKAPGTTYTTSGRNGTQHKTRPEFIQAKEHERTISSIGSDFGLDPVARAKLKVIAAGGRAGDDDDLFGGQA